MGDVVYAVDLANTLLIFGTGSIGTLTAKMKIQGLPILKRIIGIAIRPADGALIGIGNDSRMYAIDPLTAEATAISTSPFSPGIVDFFEIHFAMAVEPNGDRIRLIAAEGGGNWSISLADGTATKSPKAVYAAGTPLAGRTPSLLGLVYPTLPDSAKGPDWCANLAYAIDSDEAIIVASCDPATGEWWPVTLPSEASVRARPAIGLPAASATETRELRELKDELLRCGEVWPSPEGVTSEGERPPAGETVWNPDMPDGPLWVIASEIGRKLNRVGTVSPVGAEDVGIHWIQEVPSQSPIQSALFDKGGLYGPRANLRSDLAQRLAGEVSLMAGADEPAAAAGADPWAQCQ